MPSGVDELCCCNKMIPKAGLALYLFTIFLACKDLEGIKCEHTPMQEQPAPETSSDTVSDVAPLGAALPPIFIRDSAAIAASAAAAAGGRSAVHKHSKSYT